MIDPTPCRHEIVPRCRRSISQPQLPILGKQWTTLVRAFLIQILVQTFQSGSASEIDVGGYSPGVMRVVGRCIWDSGFGPAMRVERRLNG